MGPGLLASDDLPWKEALGTYLCTDRCVGFGLVAPEMLEDGEAGEVLHGPEKLVLHENWVCRAPALGEAPGVCRKRRWLPIPASAPSHLPRRQGQLQPPIMRKVPLLWGWQIRSPLSSLSLQSRGTFFLRESPDPCESSSRPAHEFKALRMSRRACYCCIFIS